MAPPLSTPGALNKSRPWLISIGILSILVGFFAIAFPLAMTVAIEQVIGIVLIITGVFAITTVLFGEERNHRVATVLLALIRLAAGLALLIYTAPGVLALTTVLCAFFFAEGVVFLVSAFTLRHNRAWILILLNGLVAFVLGGLIFAHLPSAAAWAIGLLYGINSIFYGASLLGFAAAGKAS
ncbi:MAG: DUF308 domain-containing protein [Terrimicrobiaceae bacterium]|nr:DUF308 domain-containing protein [Terrimicrobiaceae bacterium]